MATYRYQQNMFMGASEGYVKYNVTPDFGTPLVLGDTLEFSGIMYSRDFRIYGIEVASTSFSVLGQSVKSANKGVATPFAITAKITQNLIDKLESRAENIPIIFTLFDSDEMNSGSNTYASLGQELYVFSYVLNPVLSNFALSDESGAYEHFGVGVQDKSKFIIDFDYQLDPLFTGIFVENAVVLLGGTSFPVKTLEAVNGHAKVTLDILTGIILSEYVTVTLTDSQGNSGSITSNVPLSVYAYSPPFLSSEKDADIVQRYDFKTNDYGEEEIVYSADGRFLSLTFNAVVCAIADRNNWTLKVEYADEQMSNWIQTNQRIYSNGENISFINDRELIGEAHVFESGLKYYVRITATDFFETATLIGSVDKATAYLNVTKHGVGIGMRSTATANEPKTETIYPLYPYTGIVPIEGASKKITVPISEDNSFEAYDEYSEITLNVYGNIVNMTGVIKPTQTLAGSNDRIPICHIPEEYAPSGNNLVFLQQGTGNAIWLLTVHPKDYYINPLEVSFSRYRIGNTLSQATTSTWLPFSVFWII